MTAVTDIRDHDWKKSLVWKPPSKDGEPKLAPDAGNAYLMLTNGQWRDRIAHDSFKGRTHWCKDGLSSEGFSHPRAGDTIEDHHLVYLQHWFAKLGQPVPVNFSRETLRDAVNAAGRRNQVNPLTDWLHSLAWDGVQRLPSWCHTYLGSPNTPYTAAVGKWWMISAVARAMKPGCQADHVLVLAGNQGVRKSSALKALAGEADWFLPQLPDLKNPTNAYQAIRGRWIGEIPELDSFRRTEIATVKAFVTIGTDVYRSAYGHNVEHVPRTIVFAASTNERQFLEDPTGARRFWPISCGNVDIAGLRAARVQLWAEAVARYETGEQWHPTDDMVATITDEQEERFEPDVWEQRIVTWADKQYKAFDIDDVFETLFIPVKDRNKQQSARIGQVLQRAGYESERRRVAIDDLPARRVRVYLPKAKAPNIQGSEDDD